MHPAKMAPVSHNTTIHVHGFQLQGANLENARNQLTDPLPGKSQTRLPVMQIVSLKQSSAQAALEVAFDCPVFTTPRPPPSVELTHAQPGSRGGNKLVQAAGRFDDRAAGDGLDSPSGEESAAGEEEAGSLSEPLARMILPVESPQDQQRWILRGVIAVCDPSPQREGLAPEEEEEEAPPVSPLRRRDGSPSRSPLAGARD